MGHILMLALLMLPAFPNAMGFGSDTVGGSGRHLTPPHTTVYKVTSLADAGAGTLRECIDAQVPRVCVFEVSGTIPLRTNLRVLSPYLTIAGETSPGGVMLRNAELGILTHDVVVRHLHIRSGDDPAGSDPGSRGTIGFYGDAPSNPGAWNIIADHMSLSWSVDENVDTWYSGVHDVTVSNSILAEPLYASIHPSGPQSTNIIVGEDAKNISFIRDLLAHGFSRNPYAKGGNAVEMVNNVVYHWGFGTGGHDGSWAMADLSDYDHIGKPSLWNFIGNVFKCGPDSECRFPPIFSSPGADALPAASHVYVRANVGPGRPTDSGDEWAITNGLAKAAYCTAAPALPSSNVMAITVADTMAHVLANAGAFPAERDSVDTRIVSEVQAGTGQFINCVAPDGSERCTKNAGSWPAVPENHRTLTLPANPDSVAANGYTALENWLHTYPRPYVSPNPTPSPSPSATPTPIPTYPPCS